MSCLLWPTVNVTIVSSIPIRGVKYLICSFPRSVNETKRGAEFHHSTRNAPRIRRKARNGSVISCCNGVS